MDQSTFDTISKVKNGISIVPDFKGELCAGCVQACPHNGSKLTGPWESRAQANVL